MSYWSWIPKPRVSARTFVWGKGYGHSYGTNYILDAVLAIANSAIKFPSPLGLKGLNIIGDT